ncbi:hypothetical protein JTB14_000168 [Gonioctena quinquepunctata]|nr:hypothetical protein JTB14_000168 [Gonioctena quinquepunctata]
MTAKLSVVQCNLISAVAQQNGFSEFKVKTDSGSAKGDNYLGIITKVTIENGERKLELILKSASLNDDFRNSTPIHDLFRREIHVYEAIFVELEKFQKNNHISNPFLGHAKFYGKCNEEGKECLVMANMIENGTVCGIGRIL